MSLNAYQNAQTKGRDPRETEYQLFAQVTSALIKAQKIGEKGQELFNALDWNRRMWSVLSTDCGAPGNQLPKELRAGILSLSIWVSKHTSLVIRGNESVEPLIDINKTIMEGLAQRPDTSTSSPSSETPHIPGSISTEI